MLRPGRGGGANSGAAGGGYYGGGGGIDVGLGGGDHSHSGGGAGAGGGGGYGGGYGYNQQHQQSSSHQQQHSYNNDQSVFKDKPRSARRGSFAAVLPLLKKPVFWVALLSLFLAALAYSYRSQQARFLRVVGAPTLDDASEKLRAAERQVDELEQAERRSSSRIRDVEASVKKLEKERDALRDDIDEHKDHHEATVEDHDETLEDLQEREKAHKGMLVKLQESMQWFARQAVVENYGPGPHRIQLTASLPSDNSEVSFVIETAPLDLVPHAVYMFLEQVRHGLWDRSWFYINGPHVLQIGPHVDHGDSDKEQDLSLVPFREVNLETLAFPEYSSKFPHRKWTVGFTGRPGGPHWYINKEDNTAAHGPGGQDYHDLDEYADSCFARVVDGFDVLERIFREPTVADGEFVNYYQKPVPMVRATILPDPNRAVPLKDTVVAASAAAAAGKVESQAYNTAADQATAQKNDKQQQQQQVQNPGVDGNAVASEATSNEAATAKEAEAGAATANQGEANQGQETTNGGSPEKRPPHFTKLDHQVKA